MRAQAPAFRSGTEPRAKFSMLPAALPDRQFFWVHLTVITASVALGWAGFPPETGKKGLPRPLMQDLGSSDKSPQ